MRWLTASIVRQLVVITLVAGLLTGVAGAIIVQRLERGELLREAADNNLVRAERTATRIDDRIGTIRGQLELLVSNALVAGVSPGATPELEVALRVSQDLDALVLYDISGNPVAAAATASLLRVEDLPSRAVADPSHPAVEIVDGIGQPELELTVSVEDPPGNPVGFLVGRAPLALVTHDVTAQPVDTAGGTFLTDSRGTVIAHRELQRVLDGETFPVTEVFADADQATIELEGIEQVVAASRPQSLPAWVVVGQATSDIVRPALLTVSGITQVLLAVVLAIVVAVILAGQRLLRPLEQLVAAAGRLEGGDLDVRVASRGVGEVAVLADGFNRMATALSERQRDLEEAERSARASEERLRLMVEGVADYAIVLLDRAGRVRSWNTGARRLTGYSSLQADGRLLADFYDPDEPPSDPIEAASTTGRAEVQGWCRRRDGGRFWANIVVTALAHDSEAYGYATILHDLTERRAVREAREAALRREQQAADELRDAGRIKDEFLAIAAHEMRTPLSAILGAINVLSEDWDHLDDIERSRFHAMIEAHAEDMGAIVDRLVDFISLQAGRVRLVPERFDLRAELEALVAASARDLVAHRVLLEAPEMQIELDRGLLRHVTTNLLSNAAKFSPSNSTITIRAQVGEDELVLAVADEGPGIPAQAQELIFDLFRQAATTAPSSRGTGVGLAIVKRYVELAGGHIDIDSRPDEGTTFTVTFPRSQSGDT